MKQPRMNVQTVAEVLIDELDKLEKTTARIEKVLPAVDHRLKQIRETTVPVDTEKAQAILSEFKRLSQERSYLPRWIVLSFAGACVVALFGVYFFFTHLGEIETLENQLYNEQQSNEVYQEYFRETDQVEKVNAWLEGKRKEQQSQ